MAARVDWRVWVAVGGQALVAVAWWGLRPGGFAITDLREWANRVLPVVIVAAMALGIARRGKFLALAGWAVAAGWAGAGVAAILLFPQSGRIPCVVGIAMAGLLARAIAKRRGSRGMTVGACAMGATVGILMVVAQKPGAPGTVPWDGEIGGISGENVLRGTIAVGENARVMPREARVICDLGRVSVYIDPMLTLTSRSADGGWVNFASAGDRRGATREMVGVDSRDGECAIEYHCDGREIMRVERDGEAVKIDARSELPRAVWSHLNTYCAMFVAGHRKLSLEFSPCAGREVEVLPSDYPVGRPRRLAYLDAQGVFHVAEARSAEKGPFRDLCSGKMNRSDALGVTLMDEGKKIARVTLLDWAAQCDTTASPTAGYGLPGNAIEFFLDGEEAASGAEIDFELSATSVGRGFDCVGHTAGVYRDRVIVERIEENRQ